VIEAPGVKLRVLLGTAFGETSPVHSYVDTLYVGVEMENGAELIVPTDHAERAVYVLDGLLDIGGQQIAPGHMAVLQPGVAVKLSALTDSQVMLLGGAPLDGPRYIWWNFVASTKERIEAAKERWRRDEFPAVPGETERIPLPER
jgi:redox-sensitive bicupin YhaK (pirin superfamily)